MKAFHPALKAARQAAMALAVVVAVGAVSVTPALADDEDEGYHRGYGEWHHYYHHHRYYYPGYVYEPYAPPPVVVYPPAPPVVYAPPPPVYYAPAPVYVPPSINVIVPLR